MRLSADTIVNKLLYKSEKSVKIIYSDGSSNIWYLNSKTDREWLAEVICLMIRLIELNMADTRRFYFMEDYKDTLNLINNYED